MPFLCFALSFNSVLSSAPRNTSGLKRKGKMKKIKENTEEKSLLIQMKCLLHSLNNGTFEDVKTAAHKFTLAAKHQVFKDDEVKVVTPLLNSLTKFGLVPSVPEAEEREIDERDFSGVSDKAIIACQCITIILNDADVLHYKHSFVPLMIFCSQHIVHNPWSSLESVKHSKEVLELLVHQHNCKDIFQFLVAESEALLIKKVLQVVVPYLSRSNWKCNPGMKASFKWLLFHTKHPFVDEVFSEVLPPSLLFIDDFILENRILGIACVDYILKNTTVAELRWYGRADVIYNALKNLIYHREPRIIISVYPCILKVLSVIEDDPKKPKQIRKKNRYDVIYQLLLKEMDMEQTITLRRAYSQNVYLFPNIMGITILKHLKTTLRILLQYLEVFDGSEESTRLNCLKALHELIIASWPRIGNHIPTIVKGLVRLLYDISHNQNGSASNEDVVTNTITCLQLLYGLQPNVINDICKPLLGLVDQIPELAVINDIWSAGK